MHGTSQESISSTLLVRLQNRDREAWEQLTTLYSPLVYHWCRRANLAPESAADVLQEVFRSVSTALDRFRRDRPGDTFRGWLAVITRNKIRDHLRLEVTQPLVRGGTDFRKELENLPDPNADASLDGCSAASNEIRGVLHRAIGLIRNEFEENTWQAFWMTTVDERIPADVAADLQVTVNAVYKAKSRVLRRLRDQLDGLEGLHG